jgi:hypothetical protein
MVACAGIALADKRSAKTKSTAIQSLVERLSAAEHIKNKIQGGSKLVCP